MPFVTPRLRIPHWVSKPVNHFERLPNELLGDIFSYYTLDPYAKYRFNCGTYASPQMALSAICSRFMAVVQTTPILWTYIYLKRTKDTVDDYLWALLCLKRSGICSLDIDVNWADFYRNPGESQMLSLPKEERIEVLLALLLPHASRWRTARLSFDYPIYGVLVLKPIFNSVSMPLLECLSVQADDTDVTDTRSGAELWGDGYHSSVTLRTPRLTKFEVSGLGFDWTRFPFRGLTELSLSMVPESCSFTIHEIRAILEASPLLHTLKFNSVQLEVDEETTQVELAPVALNYLTTLHLCDFVCAADFSAIVSIISTPCLTSLSLLHPTGCETSTHALMDIISERYFTLEHLTSLSLCEIHLPPRYALVLYSNLFRAMQFLRYLSINSCCENENDNSALLNALSLTLHSRFHETMSEPNGTMLHLPRLHQLELRYEPKDLPSLRKALELRRDHVFPLWQLVVHSGRYITVRVEVLRELAAVVDFAGTWKEDSWEVTVYTQEEMDIDHNDTCDDDDADEVEAYLLNFDPAVDESPIVADEDYAAPWKRRRFDY